MSKAFGWVQRTTLEMIAKQSGDVIAAGAGRALYVMLDLRGRASNYSGRYAASVANAVLRHNSGECGDDCPIPPDAHISAGAVGPRGGFGYFIDRQAGVR